MGSETFRRLRGGARRRVVPLHAGQGIGPTPAIDGPELSEVLFAFEPEAMTLVSVTAYHESVSEDVAAARGSAVAASLEKSLGAPHKAGGRFEAAYLAEAAPRTATVSYAHRDYVGGVSATKLRRGTTILREQYMRGMR